MRIPKKGVLVTGVTGLVGSGIANFLLKSGYFVKGTSRKPLASEFINQNFINQNFINHFLNLDRIDECDFKELFEKIDVLIINAAKLPEKNQDLLEDYIYTNVLATEKLLIEALNFGLKKIIYISGTGIMLPENGLINEESLYSPYTAYHLSKIFAEQVVLKYSNTNNNNISILRFPGPYGLISARDSVLVNFVKSAIAGHDLKVWGNGSREQTFTHIDDIGHACDCVIKSDFSGVLQIAGPESISMLDLAQLVLQLHGNTKSKIIVSTEEDPQEGRRVRIDFKKASELINYKPVIDLRIGLTRMLHE